MRCLKRNTNENLIENRNVVDKEGSTISEGDWVKAMTKGKFKEIKGRVVSVKK